MSLKNNSLSAAGESCGTSKFKSARNCFPSVAVLGIGGLGHLAVQYAKAAGFETIAISHPPDKDKMIRDLGADEIVRDGKSLAAAGGADVILKTAPNISTKPLIS